MLKKYYMDVIEPATELATLVFNHFGKTPMGWTGIDKLTEYAHNEQFANRVFELKDFLEKHNGIFEGINPSQYYKIIYKFQLATKSLNITVNDICSCYLFLANYAIELYNYNVQKMAEFVKKYKFTLTDSKTSSTFAYLSALVRGFSEAVYCDEHTVAGEIYSFSQGDYTVIGRKYINLNAIELYSELNGLPISKMEIYGKYKGVENPPKTDIVGNLLTSENIMSKLKEVVVIVCDNNDNRKQLSTEQELASLCDAFENHVQKVLTYYKKLPMQERLWKKIECEYYAMKCFCDQVGLNWQPISYDIDENVISSPTRPIVLANETISKLNDDKTILEKLIELNNPKIHW